MNRSKWLGAALLPLALAGAAYASSQLQKSNHSQTNEQLPGAKCCSANQSKQALQEQPFTCPVTGEQLPCEKCCPLNHNE